MHKHPMIQTREDQLAAGRAMAALDEPPLVGDTELDFAIGQTTELPGELADSEEPDDEIPEPEGTEEEDTPEHATVPAPSRRLPRPLESLAARSSVEVAAALRTVDLVNDQFRIVPSSKLGRRGEPIGPMAASMAPDTGLLEFVVENLNDPIFEIEFFRPGQAKPYLTVGMTRAQALAGSPARTPPATPANPADRLTAFMTAMEKRQSMIEDMLLELQQAPKATPAPSSDGTANAFMQEIMKDCMTTMFGGFKVYMQNLSAAMGKGFQPGTGAAPQGDGLLGKLAQLKKLKAEMQDLSDIFGGGSSEVDDAVKLIGAFTGGGKIDKDEAKRITDEVAAQLDEIEGKEAA